MITHQIPGAGGVEIVFDTWAPTSALSPGADPPAGFLLVHGLASNARLWDGVAAHLAALGHPVATVDLRGHGRSGKPDDGYDIPTVCEDLVAVLGWLAGGGDGDTRPWQRPVAVGQSWGGNVVLELAFAHPARLRGVACVDGGTIALQDRFPSWAECALMLAPPRLAGTPGVTVEAFLRQAHPRWPDSGIQGTMGNFEIRPDGTVAPWLTFQRHMKVLHGLWDHQPVNRYPSISVPVLLIPADDGHTPSTEAKRAEVAAALHALPVAAAVWIEGDHDLHAQFPAEIAGTLHEAARAGLLA